MDVISAAKIVIALMQTAERAISAARGVQNVIKNAQEQGREVTLEEVRNYVAVDDQARAMLQAAIDEAEQGDG